MSAYSSGALRTNDVVTLLVPGKSKVQVEFETAVGSDWQLKLSKAAAAVLSDQLQIKINFVRSSYIHSASSQVVMLDRERQVCIISEPSDVVSRPVRRWPRTEIELPTAIVLMSSDGGEAEFSYRKDNIILNISEDGVLIASRQIIGIDVEVLLLTCLDQYRPYQRDEQFYMRGKIVRETQQGINTDFPFAYGIQFTNMFPKVKNQLRHIVKFGL